MFSVEGTGLKLKADLEVGDGGWVDVGFETYGTFLGSTGSID